MFQSLTGISFFSTTGRNLMNLLSLQNFNPLQGFHSFQPLSFPFFLPLSCLLFQSLTGISFFSTPKIPFPFTIIPPISIPYRDFILFNHPFPSHSYPLHKFQSLTGISFFSTRKFAGKTLENSLFQSLTGISFFSTSFSFL